MPGAFNCFIRLIYFRAKTKAQKALMPQPLELNKQIDDFLRKFLKEIASICIQINLNKF